MVNFVPPTAEISSLVGGTRANFNGFCSLAALLHGTVVVGVSKLCGVEQRAPPIFSRATITLGIGPHSSNYLYVVLTGHTFYSSVCLQCFDIVGRVSGLLKKWGGCWRWELVSLDGVAPSRMVSVSASVNLPSHHKVLFWHRLTQVVPEKGP